MCGRNAICDDAGATAPSASSFSIRMFLESRRYGCGG